MSDPRLTPANGRVAAMHLAGQVEADAYLEGWPQTVRTPVADLCRAPEGPRDRQLLLGADVTVFEVCEGWAFVQAADRYVGYVLADALGDPLAPTHFVSSFATHAYAADDFKSPVLMSLPFGARVRVTDERRKYYETTIGFVPKRHLRGLDRPFQDPATVAQLHFGVPYLWGGNATRGIDCSGLITAGLSACGVACPGDSDMQLANLGTYVTGEYLRGDLMFWQGHVGMMVDDQTMVHATETYMATVYEPIAKAIARIAAQGDGPVLAHKRL